MNRNNHGDNLTKTATKYTLSLKYLLLVFLCLFLSACTINGQKPAEVLGDWLAALPRNEILDDQDPAAVTEAWLQGFLESDLNTLTRYTCDEAQQAMMMTFLMRDLGSDEDNDSALDDLQVTFTGVTFEMISETADSAQVTYSGIATISRLGILRSVPVGETITLKYESEHWKVCVEGE